MTTRNRGELAAVEWKPAPRDWPVFHAANIRATTTSM